MKRLTQRSLLYSRTVPKHSTAKFKFLFRNSVLQASVFKEINKAKIIMMLIVMIIIYM